MKVYAIKGDELTPDHRHAWSQLQCGEPPIDNPFLHSNFTRAVAAVRTDVEVAVLEDGGEYVGFLPFQRGRRGIGRPVASRVSELHGMVARPQSPWRVDDMLRGCGLSMWQFDCVPVSQRQFQPFHLWQWESSYIDLRRGFKTYAEERRRAGSHLLRQALRKARKFEREVGPLRFEMHTSDSAVFADMCRWKSAQYRVLGVPDYLAIPSVLPLLERLRFTQTDDFSGMLSALYVEDTLLAVHFGIVGHGVLGWCFPTYNPEFGKYSPGLIFLAKLFEAAPAAGIKRIDLGQGPEPYKKSFRSGSFPVAEGVAGGSAIGRLVSRSWIRTRIWAANSPLQGAPLRIFRNLRNALRTD